MDELIVANYKVFYNGCIIDEAMQHKPKEMTDNAYYRWLNKICNVSTIGKDKKKFYKLTPENAVRFCPATQKYFKSGAMTELDVKIGAIFEYNFDIELELKSTSNQRKIEILLCEMFRIILCGENFRNKTHRNENNCELPNIFRMPKSIWEQGFRYETRQYLASFNQNHQCTLRIKDDAFHKVFILAIDKLRSVVDLP